MRPSSLLLLAALAAPCPVCAAEAVPAPAATPAATRAVNPEQALLIPVGVLRNNDFAGFYQLMPPEDRAKAEKEWEQARADAAAGKLNDAGELNQFLGKLLAPNAVDTLVAETEPKLQQLNPQELSQQMQMAAQFLPMMLNQPQPGQSIEKTKFKQAYATALQGLLTDASAWVLTAGINDPKRLRSAIERLVAGAKVLGVKNAAEFQALPFTEALTRLGPVVKEAKGAAAAYDVQIDAFLDSVKVAVQPAAANASPDRRVLSVSFTAFAKPYSVPVVVERKDGVWIVSPENSATFAPAKGGDDAPLAPAPGAAPQGNGIQP